MGDAVGACDPLTLSGLRYALRGAEECARAIALGRDEIYIEYIKKLKRRFTFMRAMQKIFYLRFCMYCVFNIGCRFSAVDRRGIQQFLCKQKVTMPRKNDFKRTHINIENSMNLIYNNILADFAPQPRREPLISRKGVRLMIQFDGIRAALPEMEKTLKEVGDSL